MYKKHYGYRDSTKKLQSFISMSLKKKDILKLIKKNSAEERLKALEGILILKQRKK